jgi:hypothetical protein
MRQRIVLLWILAIPLIWLAHLIGFMIHEYAHSITAWLLHYKANPLALNYGHLTAENILMQSDIDENVDYGPIFAAGRGPLASVIALAGVLIGNGLSYFVSRVSLQRATLRNKRVWGLFFFLLYIMSVGNFIDYVPVRTFTDHGDMATAARGLNASPWVIAIGLGIPFALALWRFFTRVLPEAEAFLFPDSRLSRKMLVLITTFLVFFFFGSAGLRHYGAVSHWLSVISEAIFFPGVTLLCWFRRPPATRTAV